MRLLCTNDDGILAHGLDCLVQAAERLGEVTVVAPDREQSATSHSLTLHHPILPAFLDTLDIRRLRVGREHIDLRLIRYPEDVGVLAMNMTAPIDIVVIK